MKSYFFTNFGFQRFAIAVRKNKFYKTKDLSKVENCSSVANLREIMKFY